MAAPRTGRVLKCNPTQADLAGLREALAEAKRTGQEASVLIPDGSGRKAFFDPAKGYGLYEHKPKGDRWGNFRPDEIESGSLLSEV